MHGTLRWVAPRKGGLSSPVATDYWVRPAWIEPGGIGNVASLVIEGIVPGAAVSPRVSAYWLMWDALPDESWTVRRGDVLAVTEDGRAVAFLAVQDVTTRPR